MAMQRAKFKYEVNKPIVFFILDRKKPDTINAFSECREKKSIPHHLWGKPHGISASYWKLTEMGTSSLKIDAVYGFMSLRCLLSYQCYYYIVVVPGKS